MKMKMFCLSVTADRFQCIMCHLLGMDPSAIWHLEIRQGTYTKFGIYKDFPVLKGMNLERREILE